MSAIIQVRDVDQDSEPVAVADEPNAVVGQAGIGVRRRQHAVGDSLVDHTRQLKRYVNRLRHGRCCSTMRMAMDGRTMGG